MTEDEMKEILNKNAERIKNAAVEAVIERVKEDLKYSMPEEIRNAIKGFMEAEIAPAVVKALQSQKGEILSAVKAASAQIGAALATQMVENATKQLTGYRGGELLKKLVDD